MTSQQSKRRKLEIAALVLGQMTETVAVLASMRTEIKSYTKKDGKAAQYFSFLMTDDSAEIRVAVFGSVLQNCWDICHTGHAVSISGGMVKAAEPKYNTTCNRFEITLASDRKGCVSACEDTINPKPQAFDFKTLSDLQSMGVNASVDILGAIANIAQTEEVTTRAGKVVKVAKVSVVDQSGSIVSCTFWGSSATQVDACTSGDILAIRNAKIQEYSGSLCLGCSSSYVVRKPDDTNAHDLTSWFHDAESSGTQFQPLSSTIRLLNSHNGNVDDELYFEFPASMQPSIDRMRRVRIRCGGKQYVGLLCAANNEQELPNAQSTQILDE